MTETGVVSYLTISDIHLLHELNETSYIVGSLTEFFDDFKSTSRFVKLDIIFLAGDVFHYYKDSKHPDFVHVLVFMQRLMAFCSRHHIKLRILEGTPSHDHKQSRMFQPIADSFGDALDYKYVEVLSIEVMADINLSVLYSPDEWGGSAKVCQEQTQDLLDRYGLKKVDIACMHGMFDFQMPDIGEHPLKLDSRWYLERVKYFVNIGHEHTFHTFDRILVQGSFDRIAHGEEGKKGAIVCHLDPVNGNRFEFIENKRARIFKTVVVKTDDLDKGIAQVRKFLEKIPDKSYVRISTSKVNPILTVIEEFKKSYPTIRFKKHIDKKQNDDTGDKLRQTISLNDGYSAIAITRDNIVDLILSDPIFQDLGEKESLLRSELDAIL